MDDRSKTLGADLGDLGPARPVPQLNESQRRMYEAFGGENFAFEDVAQDFVERYSGDAVPSKVGKQPK